MVLAVLGVLGALALPQLGSQLERQRLRDAAQTLAGDISEARFLAAQRGQAVHLLASKGVPWCWTVALTPGCDCQSAPACALHATRAGDHPGVKMLDNLTVTLDPTGAPTLPSSTTFEAPHGERLRVDVSALGRPRICAAAGNWPQLPSCSTP